MVVTNYTAIIRREGDWWFGWVREVTGVNSQAPTRAELIANLQDALGEFFDLDRGPLDQPRVALYRLLTPITFPDPAVKREALGALFGRFTFQTFATGLVLVPDPALPFLTVRGIDFVEGLASPDDRDLTAQAPE